MFEPSSLIFSYFPGDDIQQFPADVTAKFSTISLEDFKQNTYLSLQAVAIGIYPKSRKKQLVCNLEDILELEFESNYDLTLEISTALQPQTGEFDDQAANIFLVEQETHLPQIKLRIKPTQATKCSLYIFAKLPPNFALNLITSYFLVISN